MISSNNNYVEKYEKPEVANGRFRNRNSKDWVENANFSSKFADFIQTIEGKKKLCGVLIILFLRKSRLSLVQSPSKFEYICNVFFLMKTILKDYKTKIVKLQFTF